MIGFYNGFVGCNANKTLDFLGLDSETEYQKNLNAMPDDWYYRTNHITYQLNANGHRSKNINEIDLDNYILTAGCSFTQGVGLKLEKTYSYLVAEKLNCDYYNIAVGGLGIDAILHNLSMWFLTVSKKPKALVIQWPTKSRFCIFDDNRVNGYGIWNTENDIMKFIAIGTELGYFEFKCQSLLNLIENLDKNIKVVHVSSYYEYKRKNDLHFNIVDLARDDKHYGIKTHELLSTDIIQKLT